MSPLVVETPLLYLDGADLVTYLTPILTGVLGPVLGPAQADTLGAGVAMIPLGVVSSDEVGAQGADLIQSYRNVGDFDLWGADFAFQASLTNQWTLGGSYSHMSDDYIEITGGAPIALNAPKDKGSLSLTFRDVLSGFNASGRVRVHEFIPGPVGGRPGNRMYHRRDRWRLRAELCRLVRQSSTSTQGTRCPTRPRRCNSPSTTCSTRVTGRSQACRKSAASRWSV